MCEDETHNIKSSCSSDTMNNNNNNNTSILNQGGNKLDENTSH